MALNFGRDYDCFGRLYKTRRCLGIQCHALNFGCSLVMASTC